MSNSSDHQPAAAAAAPQRPARLRSPDRSQVEMTFASPDDLIPAGQGGLNFGWNIFEGTLPYTGSDATGLTAPVTAVPTLVPLSVKVMV